MITFPTSYYFSKKCELFSFYSFKVNWKFSQIIVCYTGDSKWNLPVKPVNKKIIGVVVNTYPLPDMLLLLHINHLNFQKGIKFCEFKFCEDLC